MCVRKKRELSIHSTARAIWLINVFLCYFVYKLAKNKFSPVCMMDYAWVHTELRSGI